MKLLSLAICSLGIWIILSAFTTHAWVSVVFGAITAVLALAATAKSD